MRPLIKRAPNGMRYAVPTTPRQPVQEPPRQYTNGHNGGPKPTPPHRKGQGRGMAKLTDDDVRAIRADYAAGKWTQSDLAYIYDVTPATIGRVVRNGSYTHVEDA